MRSLCLLVAVLSTAPVASAAPEQPGRPNVLVILVDDLGYGDLSCYGASDLQSPYVDKLLAEGLTFTKFYANCPVCSPTRASLLTGCYPANVGVPGVIRTHAHNSWGWLSPSATTLPQKFKAVGYHTAIVGKWHLGLTSPNRPTERGFDHFKGYLGDMMDDYYNHRRHGINYMRDGLEEIDPEGHATDLFSQWACEYITARRSEPQPWFLYLAYNAPHTPIQPPKEWTAKVKAREPGISDKRAKLVALIEHMDAGIGQVLDCLKQTGQERDTLVLFTSDNGGQISVGANNGETRDGKGTVYEGGLKVPGGARWPGRIEAGTTTDVRVLSMDIFPTVLAAAGIDDAGTIDGRSFLPTLLGATQEPLREACFFTRREGGVQFAGKTIDAVIEGDYKLLHNSPFEPMRLYNLKDDPLEANDLRNTKIKVYQRLQTLLRKQIQDGGRVPWQEPQPAVDR